MALWPVGMSIIMVGILPVFDPPHLYLANTHTHTHTELFQLFLIFYFIIKLFISGQNIIQTSQALFDRDDRKVRGKKM